MANKCIKNMDCKININRIILMGQNATGRQHKYVSMTSIQAQEYNLRLNQYV